MIRAGQTIELLHMIQESMSQHTDKLEQIKNLSKYLITPEIDSLTLEELNSLVKLYEEDDQFSKFLFTHIIDILQDLGSKGEQFPNEFLRQSTLKLFQSTNDYAQKKFLGELILHQDRFLNQENQFYLELFHHHYVLPAQISRAVQNKLAFIIHELNSGQILNQILRVFYTNKRNVP